MKLIIAGSRDLFGTKLVHDAFVDTKCSAPSKVVCGGAAGIDAAGRYWAETAGVPVKVFRADWNKHGRAAGPIRNKQMAEYADELLLIWDGKSRGSANMKKQMIAVGKPVFEYVIKAR